MPTRRQRRRRQKSFRHEYGFVTTDEEGNEVELPGAELRAQREGAGKKSVAAAKPAAKGKKPARSQTRRGRDPEPASWRRSWRRGMLWSPIVIALSLIVFRGIAIPYRVAIGLVYAGSIAPMTYWMDGFVYRRFERRKLSGGSARQGRGRG